MLLLGQREIKQHTLATNWHTAKIIHLFIIVYHLRRFEISHTHHFSFAKSLYSSKYLFQGYLVDWDAEKAVWDGIFSDQVLGVRFQLFSFFFFSRPALSFTLTPCYFLYFWVTFQVNTTQACLLITEPYFNLPNLQEVYDQLVFEEYEFSSYHRCTRK